MPDFAAIEGRSAVREGGDADLPAIKALHCRIEADLVLEPEHYDAWWRWMYRENACGRGYAFVVENAQHELIGHIAVMPQTWQLHGQSLQVGIPGQLVVDEAARKGLAFVSLMTRLLRTQQQYGIDFLLAMVNRPRVRQAEIALGFRQIGEARVWARPLSSYRLLRHQMGKVLPDWLLRAVAPLGDGLLRFADPWGGRQYSATWHDEIPGDLIDFARDLALPLDAQRNGPALHWRYLQAPGRRYRLLCIRAGDQVVAYAAVRSMPMRNFAVLALVDCLVAPGVQGAAAALVRALLHAARERGADLLACLMAPHDPVLPLLRRQGFLPTPERFAILLKAATPEIAATLPDYTQWRVGWFCHDYV